MQCSGNPWEFLGRGAGDLIVWGIVAGISGVTAAGSAIIDGVQNLRDNVFSTPRGDGNPPPLLPFPLPIYDHPEDDRQRNPYRNPLHLGNGRPEGFPANVGDFSPSPGGFVGNDPRLRTPLHTGYPNRQDDLFIPYFSINGIPQPREEDVTTGPHGPNRDINDVVSRALQINPRTNKPNGPQGRWLSEEAGRQAVVNLDVEKMKPGTAYSVPIPQGAGEVVRPYNTYPESYIPASQRYLLDPTDRAIVIKKSDGIHTFPIGSENPAYYQKAPTK